MIAVGVISIATVVLGIQFKNVKPEYGILLSITGCLIIFIMMLTKLTYIINIFNQISELTNVSKEYIKILLKITGITVDMLLYPIRFRYLEKYQFWSLVCLFFQS